MNPCIFSYKFIYLNTSNMHFYTVKRFQQSIGRCSNSKISSRICRMHSLRLCLIQRINTGNTSKQYGITTDLPSNRFSQDSPSFRQPGGFITESCLKIVGNVNPSASMDAWRYLIRWRELRLQQPCLLVKFWEPL